jgi:HPt (histidine-containing phosphotransfer) domain-containing protein
MFIDMTAPQIDKLKEAQQARDMKRVKDIAHSLKGAARSACCNVLGDLAAALQQSCEDKRPTASLISAIETEFDRASQAIRALEPDA